MSEPIDIFRVRRCACGSHIMNAPRPRPGGWVMELDEHGGKHGYDGCPPDHDGPFHGPPRASNGRRDT